MQRLILLVLGSLVLPGCNEVAGIDLPCEAACKDETTRIYCDAAGKAQLETCPPSTEECAVAACEAGACTFKPAVGAPCGETGGAQCNEGFACLGGQQFDLTAIRQHTCLATDDGKVWCWGDNTYRELGDGTERPGLHPVLVRGLPGYVVRVTAGYAHTCALLRAGQIYCWGNNIVGQCGVSESEPIATPVLVDVGNVQFTAVTAGQGFTCAIAVDKTVYCWGNTSHGQCGMDAEQTGIHVVRATQIPGLDKVDQVAAVKNHVCAVRSEKPWLVCWGSNTYIEPPEGPYINYKLGPGAGEMPYSAAPIEVDLGARVLRVGMGFESTYALTEPDGVVYAWGRNNRGQLGIETAASTVPVATPTLVKVEPGVSLSGVVSPSRSDGSDMCATMRDRTRFGTTLVCWGADDWGEVGAGTEEGARTTYQYPIAVEALPPTAHRLVRGEDHACAVVPVEGRTEIWCYGRPGMLGNGTESAENAASPSHWKGASVVWDPANFAPALE